MIEYTLVNFMEERLKAQYVMGEPTIAFDLSSISKVGKRHIQSEKKLATSGVSD